jgi:DNA modification methylase
MNDEEQQLEVRYVPIGDVKPWEKNPKKHNVPAIIASIKRFGRMKPISVQKGTMMVIAGHGRLEAMKKMGFETIPITEHEMPNAEAKAYALVDNETTISGGWDDALLKVDLQEIKLELPDLDMADFGFSERQRGVMAKEDTFDVDAATKAVKEPISKTGDIISLGNHRLMCGDSVDKANVDTLMGGAKAVMIHTDPPYNVNYGSTKNPKYKSTEDRKIANDDLSAPEWESFNLKLFEIMKDVCEGDVYMWGASGPDGLRARTWLMEAGCHWSATIVWMKNSLIISPANYHRQYEPCYYGWFNKSSCNFSFSNLPGGGEDRRQSDLWQVDKPHDSMLHPTMKPIELCARAVLNSSKEGDIVLDLFGGSGSTLIACEQTKRKCYMMELDPRYCDVIVKRWEELTGLKAVRPFQTK